MSADKEGNEELVAVSDGYRTSIVTWEETLLNLKRRGLKKVPDSPLPMADWATVRPLPRSFLKSGSNDAESIRPQISSISFPKTCSQRRRRTSMTCTGLKTNNQHWQPTIIL